MIKKINNNLSKSKQRILAVVLVLFVVLLSIPTILKLDLSHNIFKLKADVQDIHGAVFDIGQNVNVKMKKLAGNENSSVGLNDTYITSIKRSNTLSIVPTEDNIVSASTSEVPIYMWYDNGTVYWYTEEEKPKLNPYSSYLFSRMTNLETIDELNQINTSNVVNMSNMFASCRNLTNLDLSLFDTSKVTNMSEMFSQCVKLTSLNLSTFNTSNVTYMQDMFWNAKSLTNLNVSNFDTSNVTNMSNMFSDCRSLTSLDVSNFDTRKVIKMDFMFYACDNLTTLNLSNFDTSNVTDMSFMFRDCSSLTSLDVSKFDTSSVTSMWQMFHKCSRLTSLDLSNFDTSNVTNMSMMFDDDLKLTTIYVSDKFVTTNVTYSTDMFCNCTSLKGQSGTTYNSNYLDKTYARIDEGTTSPGYFSINTDRILLKSDDYNIDNKNKNIFITSNIDINKISIDKDIDVDVSLQLSNNKINILYKSIIIKSYDIFDMSNLTIKNNTVILNVNNTKKTITDLLGTEENIKVYEGNTELNSSDKLKTNDVLNINGNEYQIAILGDPNGDGIVNVSDLSKTYKIYKNTIEYTQVERLSADTNEDNKINISDLSKTYKIYKGIE